MPLTALVLYWSSMVSTISLSRSAVKFLLEVTTRRGESFTIGIEKPVPGNSDILLGIRTTGLGIATSGNYRNFRMVDGQRYSHAIDPRTGRPITHALASSYRHRHVNCNGRTRSQQRCSSWVLMPVWKWRIATVSRRCLLSPPRTVSRQCSQRTLRLL